MRARLKNMTPGEKFTFLCVPKMAEKMDRIASLGGGEIIDRDVRAYGIVITIQKKNL